MKNRGFTLIELIVVLAIGAILATAGFLTFSNYKKRNDLEFTLDEVFSVVKQTQTRSVTQEDGSAWGMRFNSSSTGVDSYSVFAGTNYSSSSVEDSWGFRRPVEFGEPSGGRSVNLEFEARTGKIDNKKVISLVHEKGLDKVGDIIVNTLGKATARMEDDIVGYWHFDEGTGTSTLDASGNGNDGELIGVSTSTAASSCVAGRCLDFDGTDDYVEAADSSNLSMTDSLTLSAWVKTSLDNAADGNAQGIIDTQESSYRGYRLTVEDGVVEFGIYGGDVGAGSTELNGVTDVSDGEWHHLAGTWDGTNMDVYVDGENDGSAVQSDIADSSQDLMIGVRDKTAGFFDGLIDEVRIYDTALSSSTIKSHYEDLK